MTATDLVSLEKVIDAAFDNRDSVNTSTRGEIRDAVEHVLGLLAPESESHGVIVDVPPGDAADVHAVVPARMEVREGVVVELQALQ